MKLFNKKKVVYELTPEQKAFLATCHELTRDELRLVNGGGNYGRNGMPSNIPVSASNSGKNESPANASAASGSSSYTGGSKGYNGMPSEVQEKMKNSSGTSGSSSSSSVTSNVSSTSSASSGSTSASGTSSSGTGSSSSSYSSTDSGTKESVSDAGESPANAHKTENKTTSSSGSSYSSGSSSKSTSSTSSSLSASGASSGDTNSSGKQENQNSESSTVMDMESIRNDLMNKANLLFRSDRKDGLISFLSNMAKNNTILKRTVKNAENLSGGAFSFEENSDNSVKLKSETKVLDVCSRAYPLLPQFLQIPVDFLLSEDSILGVTLSSSITDVFTLSNGFYAKGDLGNSVSFYAETGNFMSSYPSVSLSDNKSWKLSAQLQYEGSYLMDLISNPNAVSRFSGCVQASFMF